MKRADADVPCFGREEIRLGPGEGGSVKRKPFPAVNQAVDNRFQPRLPQQRIQPVPFGIGKDGLLEDFPGALVDDQRAVVGGGGDVGGEGSGGVERPGGRVGKEKPLLHQPVQRPDRVGGEPLVGAQQRPVQVGEV